MFAGDQGCRGQCVAVHELHERHLRCSEAGEPWAFFVSGRNDQRPGLVVPLLGVYMESQDSPGTTLSDRVSKTNREKLVIVILAQQCSEPVSGLGT